MKSRKAIARSIAIIIALMLVLPYLLSALSRNF
jgi:hypothetical protein